jgi:hypothetical protein
MYVYVFVRSVGSRRCCVWEERLTRARSSADVEDWGQRFAAGFGLEALRGNNAHGQALGHGILYTRLNVSKRGETFNRYRFSNMYIDIIYFKEKVL